MQSFEKAIKEILHLWFGDIGDDGVVAPDVRARWWKKDPEFDAMLRDRFGDYLVDARNGALDEWLATPQGTLALVVLLDQFGRNIHRNTPEMYSGDGKAAAIAEHAIDAGIDRALGPMERVFLYMPLMHSEVLAHQDRCVAQFQQLSDGAPPPLVETLASNLDYAIRHRDIVAKYGRFPHRNNILGRTSTEEEREFLSKPGSSF